ncbi:hypothetical protein AMETH_3121 [Amycolatopsis methanolica 239]|uniref:Uncharacterized protein n=1 Tax=Amycolatopsis methanolica 239 TaxID=1068978 RepID=A0A076MQP4_AMYME|nr:hypothetical protein AMETH_3121 [Amycolatopsis methanolica 239]
MNSVFSLGVPFFVYVLFSVLWVVLYFCWAYTRRDREGK